MSYPFFYKSSFHISVLVVSGGTRRFTDLKSVEVLSEGRPLCRLPRLDRTRVQHSQAGLLYISTYLSNYLTIYSQAGLHCISTYLSHYLTIYSQVELPCISTYLHIYPII